MPDVDFSTLIAQFHWLRPLWLLGIPIVVLLGGYLWRTQAQSSQWQQLINPQLLTHLLQDKLSRQQRWPLVVLLLGLIIALLAMAGPSWEKLPQPIHKTESALVILYDMSPSMMAEDLKPSRLVRSRLKLVDLLNQRQEGLTALIAYAGEAHTVTPLTDDTDTIISLLPTLSPRVMPTGGSNTEMAFDQALTLFQDSGLSEGDILLVTDGVAVDAQQYLRRKLPLGYRLSILGVGTEAGAPIPARHGGFARDKNGGIVLAKLNVSELAELANKSGGDYRTLSADDRDIQALLPKPNPLNTNTRELEREFDTWLDRGAWLVLLLIPLMAFSFRRGWLLILPFIVLAPEQSYAFGWKDLWQTRDQQGLELLQQDKASEAADTFSRPDWKATAQYRAQNYLDAAAAFAAEASPNGYYNAGNALAKAGKLQEAIDAYDEALKLDPDLQDAQFNRDLVEKLLQQQQRQQDEQQDDQSQDDSSAGDQHSDQQESGQDDSQEDGSEQNSSDESSSEKDSSDQAGDSQQDSNSQQNDNSQSDSNDEQESDSPERDSPAPTDQEPQDGQDEPAGQNANPSSETTEESPPADRTPSPAQAMDDSELSDEEQQAMEQWLRQIPDDPSGLMRKKFEYQYRQRLLEQQRGYWSPPGSQSDERW